MDGEKSGGATRGVYPPVFKGGSCFESTSKEVDPDFEGDGSGEVDEGVSSGCSSPSRPSPSPSPSPSLPIFLAGEDISSIFLLFHPSSTFKTSINQFVQSMIPCSLSNPLEGDRLALKAEINFPRKWRVFSPEACPPGGILVVGELPAPPGPIAEVFKHKAFETCINRLFENSPDLFDKAAPLRESGECGD